MRKFLNLYKIGIPLILLSSTACSANRSYHCRFPDSNSSISDFDKIVEVYYFKPDQRAVFTYYFDDERDQFSKTSDKDDVIVTAYEEHRPYLPTLKAYRVLKVDMSSSPVTFNYGYGYHASVETFESMYQIPYTEKNFNSINSHPEVINYIPPKEHEQHISFGFWKKDYDCGKPLTFIGYIVRTLLIGLLAGLSI